MFASRQRPRAGEDVRVVVGDLVAVEVVEGQIEILLQQLLFPFFDLGFVGSRRRTAAAVAAAGVGVVAAAVGAVAAVVVATVAAAAGVVLHV